MIFLKNIMKNVNKNKIEFKTSCGEKIEIEFFKKDDNKLYKLSSSGAKIYQITCEILNEDFFINLITNKSEKSFISNEFFKKFPISINGSRKESLEIFIDYLINHF